MVAVSLVAETNIVLRFDPFHCTVEPAINPVPFTVSVKAAPPANEEVGEREEFVGAGLPVVQYPPQAARNAGRRARIDGTGNRAFCLSIVVSLEPVALTSIE
jgi:hypothetical protein